MKFRYSRTLLAIVMAAGVLAACGESDPKALVASAKSYVDRHDYPAAIIQLKNVLQREPENPEARFLLAQALLESGSPQEAETEVRKALDYKYPSDAAIPLLARTLLAQEQYRKVVTELGETKLADPAAQVDLAVSTAIALEQLNETDAALAMIDRAIAVKSDAPRALVAKARIVAQRGDLQGAVKLVDAALAAAPNDPEAAVVKADLLLSSHRRDDAIATLEASATAHPADIPTRYILIDLLSADNKLDEATKVLEAMKKASPRDLRTVYSDAVLAFRKKDIARARDLVQQILAVRPDHLQSLYLSGLVNYQLKSYAAAEDAFRRVLAKAPGEPGATRALAGLYLQTGRSGAAQEILEPALRRSATDPGLLRLSGEASLQSGNAAKAAQLYERANAVDADVGSAVRLAQIHVATGDATRGFAELEQLSKTDADSVQPDLALFSAYLQRRAYDKALAAATTIETKHPKSATGPYLRGIVFTAKKDAASARASFEKALAIQPDFVSAAHNLALLDVMEGKPENARKRYEQLLDKDPKNEEVLLSLADLAMALGAPADERKAAIERAIAAHPESRRPRLKLINFYLQKGDAKAALAAAQAENAAFRNDPAILEAVGAAQLAAGEFNQAIETYSKLAQLSPQSPAAALRLGNAYFAAKDFGSAIDAARRAASINDDFGPAWSLLVKSYLASGKPDAAIAEARKLQREKPDRAFGYALEAQVQLQQRQWSQAAKAASDGLARQPVPMLAVGLYIAQSSAGKASEANATAQRWLKDHPKDIVMRAFLAQQAQKRSDYRAAAAYYREALDIDAENVAMLNNLAWVLGEAGDSGALDIAERAYRLAPFNPNVIDTLGWLLVKQGDNARGTQLLRMASSLSPTDVAIKLHYVKALAKAGDKGAARRELDALAKSDRAKSIQPEIEKLRGEL